VGFDSPFPTPKLFMGLGSAVLFFYFLFIPPLGMYVSVFFNSSCTNGFLFLSDDSEVPDSIVAGSDGDHGYRLGR
jgi:hypothetical protein